MSRSTNKLVGQVNLFTQHDLIYKEKEGSVTLRANLSHAEWILGVEKVFKTWSDGLWSWWENVELSANDDYSEDFVPTIGDRVSPTFCVLPWVHRFTNIGGEVQVCCVSEEHNNDNRDANGLKINIDRIQDDQVLMNTPFMKNLRLELLKGKWPSLCQRCKVTEQGGGFSRRQFENATNARYITRMVNDTQPDGTVKVNIRSADFRLGNLCNLACRMCNPKSSSKWTKEWLKIDQDWFGKTEGELDQYRRYKYYENPKVWEAFRQQIPSLRHLHFAGGEPMVVKQMIEAMKMCVDEGYAENIWVSYNTNMTIIPGEVKELWEKFKHVRIYASIDAYGKLNDYIRHPAKWDVIHKNLQDLENNFDKYRIRQVLVACTIQAYNVTQVDQLFKYLSGNYERIMPIPHLINLYNPEHYLTKVLPPELKALAKERLLAIKKSSFEVMRRRLKMLKFSFYLESIDETINFMESEDRPDLLPAFLRAALSKDQFRKENLFDVVPEFAVLKKYLPETHLKFAKGSDVMPGVDAINPNTVAGNQSLIIIAP